jgi:hypothetical protein
MVHDWYSWRIAELALNNNSMPTGFFIWGYMYPFTFIFEGTSNFWGCNVPSNSMIWFIDRPILLAPYFLIVQSEERLLLKPVIFTKTSMVHDLRGKNAVHFQLYVRDYYSTWNSTWMGMLNNLSLLISGLWFSVDIHVYSTNETDITISPECMSCTCKKETACIGIACCSIPFIYSCE